MKGQLFVQNHRKNVFECVFGYLLHLLVGSVLDGMWHENFVGIKSQRFCLGVGGFYEFFRCNEAAGDAPSV